MKKNINKICPITYDIINDYEKYSQKGLRSLSPNLEFLNTLPLSAKEQREEARLHADKMSIQGVQLKLSVALNIRAHNFEICDVGGKYILKPQSELYDELPENEDLSMRLAELVGIEIPLHGLLYSADGSFTYFIKRFDRESHRQKIPLEDFAQLANMTRETKYNYTMEKMIAIIEKYCTFPVLEKRKLFVRTLFNYLIGNEDMHLKNFSLIMRNNKVELSPAYDLLNTTLALKGRSREEIALSLNGKKRNLKRKDLIDYYGREKLGLNEQVVDEILEQFKLAMPSFVRLINISFLSKPLKEQYLEFLGSRKKLLEL